MKKQPIQYLLIGLPYSGKTTLAKELVKHIGAAHINIDQLKFDKGYTDVGDDDVPDQVWEEIFAEADILLVQYLHKGKNVANEYAWITKQWRDRARNVAAKARFDTKLIYIKIPHEVIYQRWQENNQTKARFHWSKEELDKFIADFEEPTSDENILIYDQAQPIEIWLKEHFA